MDQPAVAGLIRGIVAAILVGIFRGLQVYGMDGSTTQVALMEGLEVALPILIGLTGWAGYDQWRAQQGIVNASDVPIAIAAKKQGRSPVTIAREFAPTKIAK